MEQPQSSAPAPDALGTFAEVSDRLAATRSKLEKRALLTGYLRGLAVEDAGRAALYLSGMPFAETDGRQLQVGGAAITKALLQVAGAGPEALHVAYRRHGDLGDAAHDLLRVSGHTREEPALTLGALEGTLAALAASRGPAAKVALLVDLLRRATPGEARYFVKLLTGDMRTGVKQALVEEAIAEAFGGETPAVRRAVMLNGSLPEVVAMAAAGSLHNAGMRLFHPLGFMLASPVDTVEEALERFADERGPESPEESETNPPLWRAVVEDKYDGIRAQLHCGDATQKGRVGLFSRSRENIAGSFPELIEAFAHVAEPLILDGEILAWQPGEQRALPFSSLQQRLGRKQVSAAIRESIPVVFMAFDVLFAGGRLLLEEELTSRRSLLEEVIRQHAPQTARASGAFHPEHDPSQTVLWGAPTLQDAFPRLLLSPAETLSSGGEQLESAYAEARARGNEGVMLKAADSRYQPGRRGYAWLKLKRTLPTLDVVITGAEYGTGRRSQHLSDYTFAVRAADGALVNVGKAYSGITDAEMEFLSRTLGEQTVEDFGHFRTVEPTVVLEVAFNNVTRSARHGSGYALRFPRILRIRDDKPVAEIDTLQRVEEIYQGQPDKPVEGEAPTRNDDRHGA